MIVCLLGVAVMVGVRTTHCVKYRVDESWCEYERGGVPLVQKVPLLILWYCCKTIMLQTVLSIRVHLILLQLVHDTGRDKSHIRNLSGELDYSSHVVLVCLDVSNRVSFFYGLKESEVCYYG